MKTKITNCRVIDPDFTGFTKNELWIEDDRIIAPPADGIADRIIDGAGNYLLPGLVDIHTHGSIGINYADAVDFDDARIFCARAGITSIAPSLGVGTLDELISSIRHIVEQKNRPVAGASIDAIHLEGPFISTEKKGAMRLPVLPTSVAHFLALLEAGDGLIKIMTLAPELEQALPVIAEGQKRGIRMSMGHTMATYEEAIAAISAGATGATHTFNAMRPLGHRDPGVLGAVLTDPTVTCEAICDLVHLSAATIQLIYRCKGSDGMILISDSGAQTGLPDGEYMVRGVLKIIRNGVSTTKNGTIAGSTHHMADGARNLIRLGIPLQEVSKMGSLNPAKAIGFDHEIGSTAVGKRADLILCDEQFHVKQVFLKGQLI